MSLTRVWTPTGNNSPGGKKRLIVLHTMEGFTGPNGAADCAAYFQGPVGASSHVCIDNHHPGKLWECVSRGNGSWTQCAYNSVAVSAEQAGYASWSKDYWLNEQRTLLEVTAEWIAEETHALGIPIRALTDAEAQGGAAGVTYHSRLGPDGCGHSDPGSGYPLAEVIEWAQAGGVPQPEPEEEEEQMNGSMAAADQFAAVSFGNGSQRWIAFFADNDVQHKPPQRLRVVGWAGDNHVWWPIKEITVDPAHQKVTVDLGDHCAGVSIQRQGDPDDWAVIGYNLGK